MPNLQALIEDESSLVSKLQEGSPALLPTDTLPALVATPNCSAQLWRLKKRPLDKPLILMAASPEELIRLALPAALEDVSLMASRFWPGALTLVIPSSDLIVDSLNPGAKSIGIRVPACEVTRNLLIKSGPLATTSANLAGQPSASTVEEASAYFPELPILGPLPWPVPSCKASTLLAWQEGGDWKTLREGEIKP